MSAGAHAHAAEHARAVEHAHAAEPPLLRIAGKLGMWVFLFSDGMMFVALVATYAMLRALDPSWPDPKTRLDISLTGIFTFVLICSSATMANALADAQDGKLARARLGILLTMIGGAGFLGFQTYEWTHFLAHGSGPGTDLFYATFFSLTGFHGFHVASGLGVLAWLLLKSVGRPPSGDAAFAGIVECGALYWHFIDLVWIVLFTVIYLL